MARRPIARKINPIKTSIKEKPLCFPITYSILTLPVDGVSVNRLSVPRLFRNVKLPEEEVEFGLNCALFPTKVIEGIEIPVGKVWIAPSVTQVPLPGGFSY